MSYTLTKSALHTATTTLGAGAGAARARQCGRARTDLAVAAAGCGAFAEQAATCRSVVVRTPQDVADAVLYLAGATSVTGVTIAVDGGQHVAWQTPDTAGIAE